MGIIVKIKCIEMNKILFLIIILFCLVWQSCEQDPSFEFKDEGKIYFKYPKKLTAWGTESDIFIDSLMYSLYGKDLPDLKDTFWVQVQIMGNRENFDRKYKVVVVEDSCSGKEGVDFETLNDFYFVHQGAGVDSFPLKFNKKAFEKVLCRNVLLQLIPTEDLGIAFVEFEKLRINFSAYMLEPDWWWAFSMYLGQYHPLKYDKVIEVYGGTDIDPYGNNPYCVYVANVVKKWFEENVVIDPFTGDRLVL